MMNTRNVDNTLAIVGALIVIFGVMVAARTALAEDVTTVRSTAVAIHTAGDESLLQAAAAHEEAISGAAEGINAANRLDLDLRLLGPISVLSAR